MWEYSIKRFNGFVKECGAICEVSLNRYGKKGWELVAIQSNTLIFKRKLKEEK